MLHLSISPTNCNSPELFDEITSLLEDSCLTWDCCNSAMPSSRFCSDHNPKLKKAKLEKAEADAASPLAQQMATARRKPAGVKVEVEEQTVFVRKGRGQPVNDQ